MSECSDVGLVTAHEREHGESSIPWRMRQAAMLRGSIAANLLLRCCHVQGQAALSLTFPHASSAHQLRLGRPADQGTAKYKGRPNQGQRPNDYILNEIKGKEELNPPCIYAGKIRNQNWDNQLNLESISVPFWHIVTLTFIFHFSFADFAISQTDSTPLPTNFKTRIRPIQKTNLSKWRFQPKLLVS